MRVLTIGCAGTSAERFFRRLREAETLRVVDVRLRNTSQLAGFAKRDDLAYFVRTILGVEYAHVPTLAPTPALRDGIGGGRLDWHAYERGFLELLAERRVERQLDRAWLDGACLVCSEPNPDRCHRRLVADYLRSAWGDVEIRHL
jgi:uncharacterized protein (DUF488 family)